MSRPPLAEVPLGMMQPTPQEKSTTCWYTCFQMMYQWKNGKNPADILPNLMAAGIDTKDAYLSGLKARDYLKASKALGLSGWGFGQSLTAADFRMWLPRTPVWVAGRWYDYNHNVIVIGISDDEVKFIDPWWEIEKVASINTWPIDHFLHGNRQDKNGTDHYIGWYSCMVWK